MNMSQVNSLDLQAAAMAVQAADGLLICAGAGMGVDSGLPDFRGNIGFWNAYPALRESGLHFQDIAHPHAFVRDARQAWGFYGHRLQLYRNTQPHAGFGILKRWSLKKTGGCFVFTSNVDGQFQRAGFSTQQVYECHGTIHRLQCTVPCQLHTWSADSLVPVIDTSACYWQLDLPRCPHCHHLARPNILMFDDWRWVDTERKSKECKLDAFLSTKRNLVVIELGSGTEVSTVRSFSERIACTYQALLVRINPREAQCHLPHSISIPMGALVALQALDTFISF